MQWRQIGQGSSLLFMESGLLAYAFLPIAMIPRVLEKVAQSRNCLVLLVAPLWPRQLWFPRLLELLVEELLRLPLRRDLVSGPPANPVVLEHTIRFLSLTVWHISTDCTFRRDFLNRLPRSLLRQDRDIKLVACHVPGMDRCSLPERHTDTSSTEGEGIVGGVATPPVSLLLNIPETRPSTRGPVCFCQESSTSSLLFVESGPPGPGTRCNDGGLVRAPVYYSWSPGS